MKVFVVYGVLEERDTGMIVDHYVMTYDVFANKDEADKMVEWLMEVKDLKEENKFLISEFDRLIKEQEEQIAKYKRLLKAAVEDFSKVKPYLSEPYSHLCDKWRYTDEALEVIGDESNGI